MILDISQGLSLVDAKNEERALDACLRSLKLKSALGPISGAKYFNGLSSNNSGSESGWALFLLAIAGAGFLLKYFFKDSQNEKLENMRGLDEKLKVGIKLILKEEKKYGSNDNFIPIVFLCSAILEKALIQLVAEPAREVSNDIIDSQVKYSRNYDISGLKGWHNGETNGSLGLVANILHGLRNGLEQKRERIKSFLNKHFLPEYEECLMDRGMVTAIQHVRRHYRNPACHFSQDSFQKKDYEELSNKIVGNKSFAEWLKNHTNKKKESDAAILHNHLVLRRIV